MSETDQLIQYIDGLKPATKTEVSLQAPATMAETITLATCVNYVIWSAGSFKNSGKNGRFQHQGFTRNPPYNNNDNGSKPIPMEINALEKKYNQGKNYNQGNNKKSYDNKRNSAVKVYYYCNNPGHIMKDCRKRQKANSSSVSNNNVEKGSSSSSSTWENKINNLREQLY